MLNVREPSRNTSAQTGTATPADTMTAPRPDSSDRSPTSRPRNSRFQSRTPVGRAQIRWADDADVVVELDELSDQFRSGEKPRPVWTADSADHRTQGLASLTRPLLLTALALVMFGTGFSFYLSRSTTEQSEVAEVSPNRPLTEITRSVQDLAQISPANVVPETTGSPSDRFGDIFSTVATSSSSLAEQLQQEALAQATKAAQRTATTPQETNLASSQAAPLITSSIRRNSDTASTDAKSSALGYAKQTASQPDVVEVLSAKPETPVKVETTAAIPVVKTVPAPAPEPVRATASLPSSSRANGTIVSSVNIRRSAENGSEILGVVPAGSSVQVNSCDNWWCSIRYDGQEGYVGKRFVDQNG